MDRSWNITLWCNVCQKNIGSVLMVRTNAGVGDISVSDLRTIMRAHEREQHEVTT